MNPLYSETCLRRPLKGHSKWSLLPGGRLAQGYLTRNRVPWSWLQWPSRTGGRLTRVVALTGFTVLALDSSKRRKTARHGDFMAGEIF